MTLKSFFKRAQKVFTPRKTRKAAVKVALPAPVRSPEEEKADKIRAFLAALEDFAYAPDVEGENEDEYQKYVAASKALGLDDVENFDGNQNSALIAAILGYHNLRSDAFDKDTALDNVRDAVAAISENNYAHIDVSDDEGLGDNLCELLTESGNWRANYNWLLEYVDWWQLARDTRNDNDGHYTDWGYFQYGSLEYC